MGRRQTSGRQRPARCGGRPLAVAVTTGRTIHAVTEIDPSALERHLPEVAESVVGGAAALAALKFPVLAVISPLVAPAAGALVSEIQGRLRDAEDVLAEERTTSERLAETIRTDGAVASLWMEVVSGLIESHDRATRRLLARALVHGATDLPTVDLELRFAAAGRRLDVIDIRVLDLLESIPQTRSASPWQQGRLAPDTPMGAATGHVDASEIIDAWPGADVALHASLGVLVSEGLVEAMTGFGGSANAWIISSFGREFLRRYREEAAFLKEDG
jgi:hypothetical protein